MYTLELFRKHFGYIGLVTFNDQCHTPGDNTRWGYKILCQRDKNNPELSRLVVETDISTYEEAERTCIEYIAKELSSDLDKLVGNTDNDKLKLIAEHTELQKKIHKLKTFLTTFNFNTKIDLIEKESLEKELETMKIYRNILSERITNFTNQKK